MAGNRPSTPRGPGPRGASGRASRARGTSRPGARPGPRGGAGRPRGSAVPVTRPPRPRFTGRAAILVLVLAVLTVSYASSMRAYLEQKEHLESLRRSIAQSQASIEDLQREKRRWRDPAYVDAQATQRLGWVMPGEVSFQVIGADGEALDHEDSLSDPTGIGVSNEPAWWDTAWGTVEAAGHPETVPDPVEEIRVPTPKKQR